MVVARMVRIFVEGGVCRAWRAFALNKFLLFNTKSELSYCNPLYWTRNDIYAAIIFVLSSIIRMNIDSKKCVLRSHAHVAFLLTKYGYLPQNLWKMPKHFRRVRRCRLWWRIARPSIGCQHNLASSYLIFSG